MTTMLKAEVNVDQGNAGRRSARARRVVRNEQQWRAIVEGQRESGLTVERYCAVNAVSRSGFWKWCKQLGNAKVADATKAAVPSFLEIPIKVEQPCSLVELDIGAMRVRIDGAAAERVIDALVKRIAAQA
jgi:hypothetical protein